VNVVAGNTYTFSTCGGATWDTQITIYNNAGGEWLGFNDDGCGLQSTLTWVATFTGQLRVLVDQYNCASNSTCANLTINCMAAGTCPAGLVADCNGNCGPILWWGDGECDWGQYMYNGVPINFSCAELNWDNGDCAPGGAPCCASHSGTGCGNAACTAAVCAIDDWCCWIEWDGICAGYALALAADNGPCAGAVDCPGGTPYCCGANGGTGCEDAACQAVVCAVDPTCCSSVWDAVCAGFAIANASSGGACSGVSNCPAEGECAPGLGGAAFPGSGSIQIHQDMTPTQLITDVFLGDCLTASNITYTGATAAVGRFTNGWGIGIESGIVLTTGLATNAVGPNNTGSASWINNTTGLNLLTNLAGTGTNDAAYFQFSFIPETESVTFTYVFASEEYPEWVCDIYNDVFGFFVTGPGYATNTNIATIPGTLTPVAIDHVNNNGWCAPYYPAYYVNNPVNAAHNQYDGFTLPLTACINTIPCETYTIIIAIADAGDGSYDSAVFLAAESFSAGVDVGITAEDEGGATSGAENCGENGCFVFTLEQALPEDLTLNYTVQHNGNGQFFDPIPVTVFFPAGTTTATVCIAAIPGTMGEELNSVEIVLDTSQSPMLGCSCATGGELVESILYFCDPATVLPVTWLDFQAEADALRDVVDCTWQTATEQDNSHFLVQRSTDMESWTAVGTVPGAGTSQLPLHYGFTDPAPLPGVSYYRIMQVDIGGGMSPSVVRRVQFGGGTRLFVHPNPGTNIFHLSGHEGGTLTMLDVRGRQVPFILTPGGELSLPGAAAGTYIAEVRWDHARDPERIRIMVR
jgi:hypothetical protein